MLQPPDWEDEDTAAFLPSSRQRTDSVLFSWNSVSKLGSTKTLRKCRMGLISVLLFVTVGNLVSLFRYYYVQDEVKYEWKADFGLKSYFRPIMSEKDTTDMIGILRTFANTLESFNISYIMIYGTLIGSWRHLGPIPWDDDIDVMVNYTEKERVQKALETLRPKFNLYTGYMWKLYLNDGSRPYRAWWERLARWRWPFVDIFFYKENATHIWDTKEWLKDISIFKKADVFPLTKRPYARLWLNAPNHTRAVLDVNFNISSADCVSTDMSHKTEVRYSGHKEVKCAELNMQYPFVKRKTMRNNTIKEVLQFRNGTVVRTVWL